MGCSVAGGVWAVCGPTLLGTAYPGRWPGQEACVLLASATALGR